MESRCLEELVPEGHRARLIWDVTGKLDLSAFSKKIKTRSGLPGRDSTDPRLMVALWLYATTEGIGSARELERRCNTSDAYKWLCGGVTINHRSLSEFRVGHCKALDSLFTEVLTSLLHNNVLRIKRVSQDGMRVRASAGASSFRKKPTIEKLRREVAERIKRLRDDVYGDGSERRKKQQLQLERQKKRLDAALKLIPKLERRKAKLAKKNWEEAEVEPRVSTTDPDAQVMRMPDGGFRPAYNVQLATDTESRLIVGVDVTNQGVDSDQSAPMREQIKERTGAEVKEQLLDSGYLKFEHLEAADAEGVDLYVAGKPPRNSDVRTTPYEPKESDSKAVAKWRKRMRSRKGTEIYKQRASTSETVNADLRCNRGLNAFNVRGIDKVKSVALWAALAYNLLHQGAALL